MPMSDYLAQIRKLVGNRLLTLPSVTGIVRNDKGEFLLVRTTGESQWTTPGGMIEPLERPSEAVVRELKEELNIDVKPVRLLGAFSGPEYIVRYSHGDEVVYVTSVFECEIIDGSPVPDFDELEACEYFSLAQIAELDTPAWLDDLFMHIGQGREYN